jgi:hypothetical protein
MASFGGLLTKLKTAKEGGSSLLSNTTVFFGSNLANASSHSTVHLPILLAGGRFKHGQHIIAAPQEDYRNSQPLSKLFVSMLQSVGMETDNFARCTGTMPGLEMI